MRGKYRDKDKSLEELAQEFKRAAARTRRLFRLMSEKMRKEGKPFPLDSPNLSLRAWRSSRSLPPVFRDSAEKDEILKNAFLAVGIEHSYPRGVLTMVWGRLVHWGAWTNESIRDFPDLKRIAASDPDVLGKRTKELLLKVVELLEQKASSV